MSKTIDLNGVSVTVLDDDPRVAQIAPQFDPPPTVSGDAIVGVLSKAQAGQVDVRDLIRIVYRDDVLVTNAKLVRIAKALGITPDELRAAAAET